MLLPSILNIMKINKYSIDIETKAQMTIKDTLADLRSLAATKPPAKLDMPIGSIK